MEFNGLVSLEFICQWCIGPKQKKTFSNEKSFKDHLVIHKPKQKFGPNVIDINQIRRSIRTYPRGATIRIVYGVDTVFLVWYVSIY